MKRHLMVLLLAALSVACGSKSSESGPASPGKEGAPADEASEGDPAEGGDEAPDEGAPATADVRVKARVEEMRQACLGDKDAVISMLVYRGDDEARRWKEPRKASDPDTKRTVDQTCAHLTGAEDLRFGRLESEEESEGLWHVIFVYGAKGQASFAFLEIDGVLLLGDVDN